TVTVTDANGCQATKTFTITEPASAISLSAGSQTNISCFGGSNGTASVSPTGGTPGYTYSWAPSGGTAATATGLVAGSYTVTVTDANGCQATKTFTITQPNAVALASATLIDATVGVNYAHNFVATGGSGSYMYDISAGSLPAGLTLNTNGSLSGTPSVAGTFNFSVRATESGCSQSTSTSYQLNINKGSQSITFGALPNKTYGDAPFLLSSSSSSGLTTTYVSSNTAVATIIGNSLTIVGAGNTTITASQVGDGNYNGAVAVDQVLSVGKKSITVTAAAKTKTYGDVDPLLTYTFSPVLVTGDDFTGSLARTLGENIGTYAIGQGTLALSSNYILNYTGADLTIGKKTITVTATAKTKTYGDVDPALAYTFAPALVTGDSFTGGLTRAVGENIGNYAIGQGTLALNPNYTLNYTGADLSIGKKTITVTATANTKIFGDVDPVLAYTFSPALVTSDSFTGSLTRAVGENIGSYTITQGSLALSTNYTLAYVSANFIISKKTIAVTATAKTKTYGEADPALTYTFAPALVTGDSFAGSLSRATGENVGAYTIGQGTLVLSSNYTLNYTKADLSINKKTITVSASAKTKIYGEADPALTYTFAPALVTGDSFTGSLARATGENVGDYAIGQGNLALSTNYTLNYTAANLSITKKTVAVTALAKAKTFGDTDPAFTYTFAPALVTGDSFTGSLTRAAGENIGDYTIGQGTLALSMNYTLTFTSSKLTIGKKTIDVVAVAASKLYGESDPVFTYTFSPDLVKGDSFIGILKRAPGENVGTYAINQGTIAVTPNYQLLFAPANLTIGKVTVNVAMASKSKVYGDIDPELTYTYSPALVSGDNFSGAPSRTPGENVGTYTIGSGTLSLNENYDVQYSPGTLSISPKALTVAADANSKIYGDVDPPLTYKVGAGLVNGDMLTGSLTRTAGENAGNYPILQGTLNGNGNYAISFTGNVLGINKKPLLISADNKSRGQGIANPPLTASYSGFIAGENNSVLSVQPVLSTTAVESSAKGSYPITIGGASAANYTIGYLNGTLTVLEGSISDIVLTSTPLYENAALNTGFGQLRTVADNPLSLFTYSLVSGNGSTDNALFNISGNFVRVAALLDYETKANYSIRVRSIDQNGLSFEKVFTITLIDVNEAPTLNALVDRAICTTPTDQIINLTGITPGPESGQTVTLGVSSSNTSMFSSLTVTKGTGTTGTLSYRLAPGAQGTVVITITATDNGGISFGGTESVIQRFVLTVNALPAPSIASDKGSAIFKGETAVLTASGGTSYVWANANGIVSGQNTAILTVKPEANTTYTVTATNASGCTETKTFTLTVTDLPIERGATVQATNIMSPNGDGVNDTWVIEDIQLFPNNSVRIVDRAGRLVYEKKGYDNSWDATLRGAPLAEGTYYYIIDFGDGKTIKKGFITILRK
ncbi:MBG domain-containing protein, partial [Pedobacter sp. Du54]|uniref:MBG domain-containing protein n=1 Tax=Pedobacter anseongensis TaxID=3133439 RepID=UPI0030AA9E01